MFADRLEISSPDGMPDGTSIQEQDIDIVLLLCPLIVSPVTQFVVAGF
jgi:hypothetical protein